MENLIIATTPLQAKIANYIENLYSEEKFLKVYITPVMNERQAYYSRDFDLVFHGTDKTIYEKALNECTKEYDKIFYASFDNPLILDIVARSKYKHLLSFDDGYADIYPKGMYAQPLNSIQVGKYGLTRDDLIKNTEKHYTLYDSDFHVVAKEKLVYLENFFKLDVEPVKNGRTAKVLLGQNFSEKDESISVNFITTYAKALNVDYYVPHPKEQFKIDNVKYLVTPLIFEDALVELFKEYEFVEVYHFTSSVSLHLKNTKNVVVKGIEVPYYNDRQKELRRLGCEFINVTLGW
ncbi:glycosyltransferase family 52 [Gemella haemolysans]|uniref:glycosyltransferase family 52 n=1 Tax=Gemella TaxID=1378 RepID=UPI00232E53C0|nr:glycosyltransferase family 52 [Gemella haemolysans]MDB6212754.1 glycosyltransferase family 52 [Gemella haemolysans]